MGVNVINPNKGIVYLSKEGLQLDSVDLDKFHPNSNVNTLQVNIEDGGVLNTMAMINYQTPSMAGQSQAITSHWYPMYLIGINNAKVANESGFRTFAQFLTPIPVNILNLNLGRSEPMNVKATVKLVGGVNFKGVFDSLGELQAQLPPTLELDEEYAIACVIDELGNVDYYQVDETSPDVYEWVKHDETTNPILSLLESKQYNIFNISVQGGFGNAKPLPLATQHYQILWQSINNQGIQISDLNNKVDNVISSYQNTIQRLVETNTVQGVVVPNLPNGQDLLVNVKRSVFGSWEVEAQAESGFPIPGTRYGAVQVGYRLYFTSGIPYYTNLGVGEPQPFRICYYDIVTKEFGVLYEELDTYMAFFNNGFTYDPINEDFYIFVSAKFGFNGKSILGSPKISDYPKPFKINKNTLIKTEIANPYVNDNERLSNCNGAVYHNGKFYIPYGVKATFNGKTWATADKIAFDNSPNSIVEEVLSPITNVSQMQTAFPVDSYDVETVIATVYNGEITYYRVSPISPSSVSDNTLKIYDIDTNTWSLGATPPTASGTTHQQGTSIIVNNKIYVKRSLLFNVYDITTNTWSNTLQKPLVGDVHNESPIYHDGYIYYGGGYVGSGSVTPVVPVAGNSDIVQRYNIENDTWELHSKLPRLMNELQGYGSLAIKDNTMYYLLGYVYNQTNNNITYVNKTVYKYDLTKGISYGTGENLLKENVDGLYVSKEELEDIVDEISDNKILAHNVNPEAHDDIRQEIELVDQKVDNHIVDLDNPHGVTAEQVDTYNKTTIDQKDADTLQEAKDYTYSKVEIDNKDTAIMNKVNNLENANMFKDVSYNNVNGVLTFTRYDDTTKEIDLPLELLVESGYYDEVTNELVLVLANGSEIRIPVDDLLTDLDAHNIRFNGSGTNYLTDKTEVEGALKELDKVIKEIDYINVQNQDTSEMQKLRLYVVGGQIGYEMEGE